MENKDTLADRWDFIDRTIRAEYANIDGIAIARDGIVVREEYFNGTKPADRKHVASVTKSVISALVGIAIGEGKIGSVDQPVADFFPEYDWSSARKEKRDVTIRNLLAMTAPYPFADWQERLDALCMHTDWTRYVLDLLGEGGGSGFKYSSGSAHLLSALITRTTGLSAREYANGRLFAPLGIMPIEDREMQGYGFDDLFGSKVAGWVKDPSGISTGGWGLTLSAREMAAFGSLYANRGEWEGKKILDGAWIDESTSTQSRATVNGTEYGYGYLWWLRDSGSDRSFFASGDGGNVIWCMPEKKAAIAILSHFMPDSRDRIGLIEKTILPAL
jgi:CubicO group peptidase (beta-lactamase class C family)